MWKRSALALAAVAVFVSVPVVAGAQSRSVMTVPDVAGMQAHVDAVALHDYLDVVVLHEYLDWVVMGEFLASMYVPPPSVSSAPSSPSAARSGGAHSDAWWRGVAQCEQGGRNDSYFGYFSFMDGSQGGRPWSDQVAAGNDLLSRYAERESDGGAWADSCVDAGYAASPGG